MKPAYCGLNCTECSVYLASVSKDTEKQARLAEEYSTDNCKFTQEDMYCLECHSDTLSEKMCRDCDIRKRNIEKSLEKGR